MTANPKSPPTYEIMFIVEPTVASKDWGRVTEELEKTIARYGGQVLSLKKWGERKLSFPIQKQQRGTYVLGYFSGPPDSVNKIRDDFRLSEIVLRFLVLAHEGKVDAQEAPKNFETVGTTREPPAEEVVSSGARRGDRAERAERTVSPGGTGGAKRKAGGT